MPIRKNKITRRRAEDIQLGEPTQLGYFFEWVLLTRLAAKYS